MCTFLFVRLQFGKQHFSQGAAGGLEGRDDRQQRHVSGTTGQSGPAQISHTVGG